MAEQRLTGAAKLITYALDHALVVARTAADAPPEVRDLPVKLVVRGLVLMVEEEEKRQQQADEEQARE